MLSPQMVCLEMHDAQVWRLVEFCMLQYLDLAPGHACQSKCADKGIDHKPWWLDFHASNRAVLPHGRGDKAIVVRHVAKLTCCSSSNVYRTMQGRSNFAL
jgi:hypothetical protein